MGQSAIKQNNRNIQAANRLVGLVIVYLCAQYCFGLTAATVRTMEMDVALAAIDITHPAV